MVGQYQLRIYLLGKFRHGNGLPLAQGGPAHIVPGGRAVKALAEFDFPGQQPPGGILQIGVHPQQIGFPPVGEGNGREIVSNLPGCDIGKRSRLRFPGDQIHPVGIDHGNQMDGGRFQNGLGGHAVEFPAGFVSLCQFFCEFQQHRGGNPLVGMEGGAVDHVPLPLSHGKGADGISEGTLGQHPAAKKRIPGRERLHRFPASFAGHGNIGLNDSQKITSRHGMRREVILFPICKNYRSNFRSFS